MDSKQNNSKREAVKEHAKNIGDIMLKYVIATLIDSLIILVANIVFVFVMDMPFGVFISIIVSLLNIVPSVGPLIGALFGALIIVIFNPRKALWFLIFTVVLQTIDGFFIKPKLYGKSFGMPWIVTLLVMIIAGTFFGPLGLIVCIPVAAIIKYICKSIYVAHKNKQNKIEQVSVEFIEDKTKETICDE